MDQTINELLHIHVLFLQLFREILELIMRLRQRFVPRVYQVATSANNCCLTNSLPAFICNFVCVCVCVCGGGGFDIQNPCTYFNQYVRIFLLQEERED